MAVVVASTRVRFGPFELDRRSGELLKFGRKIRLQDQPFQILILLLDRPGDVVTREALQETLWPGNTFVDFEHGLNNAIKRLREVLNDSAEKPRYIETLPRRGYRFIGTVENPAPEPPPVHAPADVGSARRQERSLKVAALGLIVVWLTTGFVVRDFAHGAGAIRSIVVLPMDNLSGDPTQDYLADGLTDAITSELAQVSSLRVISRTSALRIKTSKKPLAQLARELNVDAVVESSVRRSGDRYTITAQLIDTARDRHIWSRSYDRVSREVPALESEIARDVVRGIGTPLTAAETARLSRLRESNPDAYLFYLRARLYSMLENDEYNQAAIELLEKAVALDPDFALAHAALSNAYRIRANVLSPSEKEYEEKALAEIERALTLDPDLADAYVVRGNILWSEPNHFPHEKAARDYRHALELNPSLAEAHHQLANVLNHTGVLDRGLEEVQKAVALDPLNTGARFRIGINLLFQGKYDQSLVEFRATERFFPALWDFQTSLALFQSGKRQEAALRVEEALKKYPKDTGGMLTGMEALLAAAAGDDARAEDKIRRAIVAGKGYQHFHHTAYVIASSYALMNKSEPALKYLRMAADDGFPCYPMFERDPNLDHLRADPRFIKFMADLRVQWEHYRATL